jgi:sulfotransferase family protein
MDPSPTFVVSTGRCGSTFLSELFNRHPDVLSLSEFLFSMGPEPFPAGDIDGATLAAMLARKDPLVNLALERRVEPVEFLYPVDAGRRFDRDTGVPAVATIALPHLTDDPDGAFDDLIAFAATLPPAPIARQYAALFEHLRARFGKGMWVERSGGSMYFLASLIDGFPGARLIHLYRDGRETAISMSKRDNFKLMLVGLEIKEITGVNPYTVADPPPMPGLPDPLRRLVPGHLDLDALRAYEVPLERFGLHWSSSVLRGLRQLNRVDDARVLDVSYESLVTDPGATVEAIASFAGVAPIAEWVDWAEGAVRRQPSKWLQLDEPERSRLDSVCRIANGRLYGAEGPPIL